MFYSVSCYAGGMAKLCACGGSESEHPDEGMVRFEWADTARPSGQWYYRAADLQGESVLRRDHVFKPPAPAPLVQTVDIRLVQKPPTATPRSD